MLTEKNKMRMEKLAPVVLRVGMALVFFWFGTHQLQNPSMWISFIPKWLHVSTAVATKFVLMNGLFEIIGGILLVLGAYTRVVAFLLSLHLFGIAFSIGLNNIGARDLGLAVAAFAVGLLGGGKWSIDNGAMKENRVE
jgi:uncharacterized membrane protein YphA (DoxX/SURF4 family)